MPKKIDPAVKERRAVIAKQERRGKETVRRWADQAEVDHGERPG